MRNAKDNRSMKWTMSRKAYESGRLKVSVCYDWRGCMDYHPGEETMDHTPKFIKNSKIKIEDWTLEMIRQKFFVELKDKRDYEIERWMPKVIMMLEFICRREVVSLKELSTYFGMPRGFLTRLCNRDPNFRRWIISMRYKDLDKKIEAVDASKSIGKMSILEWIKPHYNTTGAQGLVINPIDVGWTPKAFKLRPRW